MLNRAAFLRFIIAAFWVSMHTSSVQASSMLRHARLATQALSSSETSTDDTSPTAMARLLSERIKSMAEMQWGFSWIGEETPAVVFFGNRTDAFSAERKQSFNEAATLCLLVVFMILVFTLLTGAAAELYRNMKQWPDSLPGPGVRDLRREMLVGGVLTPTVVRSRAGSTDYAHADFKEFRSGPFDCAQDPTICCWATACPCIRWADNMSMVGVVGYWVGILIFCSMAMVNAVLGFFSMWCFTSLLWMAFRQQLRRKFDMEHGSVATYSVDWFLYCCCCCCAISQEARHIEEAGRAGHKAVSRWADWETSAGGSRAPSLCGVKSPSSVPGTPTENI